MFPVEFSDQDEIDPMMMEEMNILMEKYLYAFSKNSFKSKAFHKLHNHLP